jgi:hypothetical protein
VLGVVAGENGILILNMGPDHVTCNYFSFKFKFKPDSEDPHLLSKLLLIRTGFSCSWVAIERLESFVRGAFNPILPTRILLEPWPTPANVVNHARPHTKQSPIPDTQSGI